MIVRNMKERRIPEFCNNCQSRLKVKRFYSVITYYCKCGSANKTIRRKVVVPNAKTAMGWVTFGNRKGKLIKQGTGR